MHAINRYGGSSKNEVILPSDGEGSMACHAVPRVMMYQDDVQPKCEIMVASSVWEGAAL